MLYSGASTNSKTLPSSVGRNEGRRVLLETKEIFSKEGVDASAGDVSLGRGIQPLPKLWPDGGIEQVILCVNI